MVPAGPESRQPSSEPSTEDEGTASGTSLAARIGFPLGPLLALAVWLATGAAADGPGGLDAAGRATAALAAWMGTWWLSEAVPIQATALLPLAAFPLAGVGSIRETATPYAHELIFLFLGGFLLALALQHTGLHRRFALGTLRLVGDRPTHMVAGFMGVTALLSMWVSNTATAVMMLPVATSVLGLAEERAPATWSRRDHRHFALALLLGIAYGASIGGVATPIGTPPNLFLLSYLSSELDREISFVRWLGVGLPLTALMLPLAWWWLVRRLFPLPAARLEGGRAVFARDLHALGALSRGEWWSLGIVLAVCASWLGRPLLVQLEIDGHRPLAGLSDAGIAMIGALLLFCAPAGGGRRVLDWETAREVPWGILLLFGGGLTLAAAIGRNGVDEWIGAGSAALAGLPPAAIVVGVVAGMVFLTELTSNTASAAALVPVLASLAPGLGVSPVALAVPAALAASFAFMLPVATPPNAVVFGSGRVATRDMVRAGLRLNLLGIVLISGLTFALVLPLLGP